MVLRLAHLGRHSRPLLSSSAPHFGRRFFTEQAQNPASRIQAYISKSQDPFLNLSIEHRLLQITPPDSTILFLYINSPCVVFGRNQNPWMEVNLARLAEIQRSPGSSGWRDQPIQLLRRRSGGGTVFHDEGNVNFSVICPPAVFDRDRHAEMVVRALGRLGRESWVNERHDIVTQHEGLVYKISGSAYKLTRLRSLHHGTCLVGSANLSSISGLLRSPAEPFIKTRGVDSVRSKVRNIDLDARGFMDEVVSEYQKMYGAFDLIDTLDERALEDASVRKGYAELKSRSWIYGQTPRFTFCTHAYGDDPRERPALPFNERIHFESRHGVVDRFTVEGEGSSALDAAVLENTALHDVDDWAIQLARAGMADDQAELTGAWMNHVLGTAFTRQKLDTRL